MKNELSPIESRVIGCLIEKQVTTPDQYPLSLNSLVSACNQKSNRDPVMDLDERTVQDTLDGLSRKHLIVEKSGFGSRVPKYQHRFCNTEFGSLKLDPKELAVVCELLLRGPQTPGELRTRASRMAAFADVSEVESVLEILMSRSDGPFVTRLAREPGRRESRYAHLFAGPAVGTTDRPGAPGPVPDRGPDAGSDRIPAGRSGGSADTAMGRAPTLAQAPEVSFPASRNEQRLARLEHEVSVLRAELDELKSRLGS